MNDSLLAMAAIVVDDLEGSRMANGNRLGMLTRTGADEDGQVRGLGLPDDHPDVVRLRALTEGIAALEKDAVANLERLMRQHPLGPWVKATPGLGLKTVARLLAAVGDPYWHPIHQRPRTVSELWAFCGLHVTDGVAARRRKGVKSNWSTNAKTRAYLVAERSSLCVGGATKAGVVRLRSPYRDVYEERRAHTATTHPEWTPGHSHADGLRVISKALLRDLWLASRALHLKENP